MSRGLCCVCVFPYTQIFYVINSKLYMIWGYYNKAVPPPPPKRFTYMKMYATHTHTPESVIYKILPIIYIITVMTYYICMICVIVCVCTVYVMLHCATIQIFAHFINLCFAFTFYANARARNKLDLHIGFVKYQRVLAGWLSWL